MPAAVAAEAAATVTLLKSAAEYANVHITALVGVVVAVNDTGSDTEEPTCPDVDPRDKAMDCPKTTWLDASTASRQRNRAHNGVDKVAKRMKGEFPKSAADAL